MRTTQNASGAGAVLVVGPNWVGDLVMAQSLFKALKLEAPNRAIDVITPLWGQALIERMPQVREAIILDVAHGELGLRRRWELGQALKKQCYAQAIVLPRSAKAALVPMIARIPQRTGYRGEHRDGLLNDIRSLDRDTNYRTVDRFIALAGPGSENWRELVREFGTGTEKARDLRPCLDSTDDQKEAAIQSLGLDRREPKAPAAARAGHSSRFGTGTIPSPILSLCPGAEYGPAKRWPAHHFARLARIYLDRGWRVWLLGSEKDAPITREILGQAPEAVDLAGQTSLRQAIDLLAASTAAVSNDSGLMHIAAATSTPLVALYGSSDPQYTPPLSDKAEVIYKGLECSPCFERSCPLGHLNCLRGITPESVSGTLDRALPENAEPLEPGA